MCNVYTSMYMYYIYNPKNWSRSLQNYWVDPKPKDYQNHNWWFGGAVNLNHTQDGFLFAHVNHTVD